MKQVLKSFGETVLPDIEVKFIFIFYQFCKCKSWSFYLPEVYVFQNASYKNKLNTIENVCGQIVYCLLISVSPVGEMKMNL